MQGAADISVIIPAYNAEHYLAEAIQSSLDQTEAPKEIIVVDDGSTDRTADVAASFGAPVRLLQQPNLGVSAARNLGIRSARCSWLAFLDSDDVMAPDRLEWQKTALLADPKRELAFGLQIFFAGKPWSPPLVSGKPARPALVAGALFCRATIFDRLGVFDLRYQGTEFIAWFSDATDNGIAYTVIDRAVIYRRVHDKNLSRGQIRENGAYLKFIKERLNRRRAL
jgi:glycosyltransferase involved in cell wall biosynthesis